MRGAVNFKLIKILQLCRYVPYDLKQAILRAIELFCILSVYKCMKNFSNISCIVNDDVGCASFVFFQKVKNLQVLNETEVLEIDRTQKRVRARHNGESADLWFAYDRLVLATGAKPVIPRIPNSNLENIFTLHGVHDAEGIKALLSQTKPRRS